MLEDWANEIGQHLSVLISTLVIALYALGKWASGKGRKVDDRNSSRVRMVLVGGL